MWENKKKFFPKFKKKMKWFLTDESWKITKKGAFGLSAGAVLLWGIEEVWAHRPIHTDTRTDVWHASWYAAWWHQSGSLRWGHSNQWHANAYADWGSISVNEASWHLNSNPSAVNTTAHWSWIVNWHYSWNPTSTIYDPGHSNWVNFWWHSNTNTLWWHINQWQVNWYTAWWHQSGTKIWWHVSSNNCNHGSHGSHGSHWSRW